MQMICTNIPVDGRDNQPLSSTTRMNKTLLTPLLKEQGLRDTQPRRMVIRALERLKVPSSPYDIHQWIRRQGATISPVTVYRILALLDRLHVVHRHPQTGLFFLCSMPKKPGMHGFLECANCGRIEEFTSKELSDTQAKIARQSHYHPISFTAAILGVCRACQS